MPPTDGLAAAVEPIPGLDVLADAGAVGLDEQTVNDDVKAVVTQVVAGSSCGNGNSFAGNTLVLMADGAGKPIDQVHVGDKIANAIPGAFVGLRNQHHTVTAVHVTYTDHAYTDVTVATTHGPAALTGTAHHLYWDATTHTWTEAGHLQVGDHLQTSGGASVTILALRDYASTMVTYNLTIDNLHTYYVSGWKYARPGP